MIQEDEDALICDFAEVYRVYNYKELPLQQAAIFAAGLPNNSRIKMRMVGRKHSTDTLLLAAICDRLSMLVWQKTKDGRKNVNRPKSILEEMTKASDLMAYDSVNAYEAARKRIVGK